jgi:hypothetical protein
MQGNAVFGLLLVGVAEVTAIGQRLPHCGLPQGHVAITDGLLHAHKKSPFFKASRIAAKAAVLKPAKVRATDSSGFRDRLKASFNPVPEHPIYLSGA